MRMPSGVVNERGHAGHLLDGLAHLVSRARRRARARSGFEHDQHVRERVRHRILGALGAAGAPHDVLDLGERAQHVLDAVVQPVDLVERRLGRQERLHQERALVELRHEVRAEPRGEPQRGHRDRERDNRRRAGVAQRAIEQRP